MAENKYDLLLVNTLTDKKIREQPWYKERLKTKYLKGKKPSDVNKTLQSSSWTFLVDGLDDFRDGLPPEIDGDMVVKNTRQCEPNIQGDSDSKFKNKKVSVNKGRFTKEEVAYYKTTPMEQQRRDHINEMEYGLLQHPLALYPHLEESMPPDVFEDVVDILDPEMNLESEDEDDEFPEEMTESMEEEGEQEGSEGSKETESGSKDSQESDEQKIRNPYRWLPRREDQQKDDKKGINASGAASTNKKRSDSPSQDVHIKEVTKDFCDWVESLGGESNNVEESTITSLFASGYETKPALSVPIHVVELSNVPPELRMSATVSQEETPTKTLEQVEKTQKELYQNAYTPSWVQPKFGAWYLNPKTWTKRAADEPLQDPKTLKEKETSDSKQKSLDMDETLAPLHGSKSFKEFVERKGTRMPEFLERVAQFQAEAEAEAAAAANKTSPSDRGRESMMSRGGRSSIARSAIESK